MLEVLNVSAGYDNKNVVHNISFSVESGKMQCIIGINGSGKSTLLKAISGYLKYTGKIFVDNKDIKTMNKKEIANNIAILSQLHSTNFPFSVYYTVMLARYPYIKGVFKQPTKEDIDAVENSLSMVDMLEYKDKNINNLSGGQLQRVFLARAFAQSPKLLLLDEPTNHLDLKHQIEILQYVKKWAEITNNAVVAVLHDLNIVNLFSEKTILLHDGILADFGMTNNIMKSSTINNAYDMNVQSWMKKSLSKWV